MHASATRESRERLPSRVNPVEATPTIAIWSLIGLRAMLEAFRECRVSGRRERTECG